MVWKHVWAWVSIATWYHPFRWQNASHITLNQISNNWQSVIPSIRSAFSATYMVHCMRWPMHQHSRPVRWNGVRCFISSHVPSLTQSRQCCFAASRSLQVACSATKAVVRSSCSSWGGSCIRNSSRFLWYAFSRLFPCFPAPMVATMAW